MSVGLSKITSWPSPSSLLSTRPWNKRRDGGGTCLPPPPPPSLIILSPARQPFFCSSIHAGHSPNGPIACRRHAIVPAILRRSRTSFCCWYSWSSFRRNFFHRRRREAIIPFSHWPGLFGLLPSTAAAERQMTTLNFILAPPGPNEQRNWTAGSSRPLLLLACHTFSRQPASLCPGPIIAFPPFPFRFPPPLLCAIRSQSQATCRRLLLL